MSTEHHTDKVTLLSYIIVGLAACFYFYEFFLQVSPSVLANKFMHEFHINATRYGFMSSSYFITYTIMQIPGGLLYDRYGARKVITCAMFLCAFGAAVFGFSYDMNTAIIGRMLMGAGSAFAFVGTLYLILRWFPPQYFALMAGVAQTLSSLGAIGGEIPLSYLIDHFSWRNTIYIVSAIGFVLTLVIWLVVRNSPKMSQRSLKKTTSDLSVMASLKVILKRPQTWFVGLYGMMIWAPIATFAALWGIPYLVTKYGIANTQAAQAIAAVWIGIGVGSPLIGWISDRIKIRKSPIIISALIGLVAMSIIIYAGALPMILLYLLLFLVGLAASGQSLTFAIIKDINHIKVTSTAIGFNNMAVVCGGIIFQPLVGRILDMVNTPSHGLKVIYSTQAYDTALAVLPACYIVCIIASIFLIKETNCKHQFRTSDPVPQ